MDNSNYYKLKYLTYKLKYLKKMYGGKLKCTCSIINKETNEVSKETCECEVYDDNPPKLNKKKQDQINKLQLEIEKIQAKIKKIETL